MTRLMLYQGNEQGRLVNLDKPLTVIGRSPQADLTLDDERTSRQHAQIRRDGTLYIIRDLGSRNGTLVNGSRLESPQTLRPGDRIEIGRSHAIFDPNHATAISVVVDMTADEAMAETASGTLPVGDEGTLLNFKPKQAASAFRRDPMVRLKIIYHFADRMRQCFDMDTLLQSILDGIFEVLTPDRAAVLLTNSSTSELESAASRTRECKSGNSDAFDSIPISSSIVSRAVTSRMPVIARDALGDQRFSSSESIIASRIGTAVCVPMISGSELCGILYLDFLLQSRTLEEADLELLVGMANQSAMAIGNSMHHQEEVARREIEMQLGVARRLHDKILGNTDYTGDGLTVRAINRPSATVGGDFLGVFTNGAGPIVAVADGTGHGIGAALLMGTARAYLVAMLDERVSSLPEVVTRLNRLLAQDVDPGLFVSLALLQIDPKQRRLTGVSAGHEPPLLYRGGEGRFVELPTGGTVLGLDAEAAYTALHPIDLQPGDRIVLFTDGIVEQLNVSAEEFGFARFREAIAESANQHPAVALSTILRTVDQWRAEIEQGDDYSLMIIQID